LAITFAGVAESKPARRDFPAPTNPGMTILLWSDSRFVRIALANALSYGVIFAYISGSPVVIIGQMGLSTEVFAGVFACTAAALTAGAWTSGRLSRGGASAAALVNPGLLATAAAALALAAVSLLGFISGAILIPLLLAILFARGIIAPNLQHLAIERQREQAGTASAAVGVSQLLAGALASAVVAILLQSFGPGAVAVPMALLAAAAFVTWVWAGR
jgi:DHA1 family bicyclomycin/chloramphenicol resistance-like MFS transporter